jgi:predicted TIM-barrel fold metal-dependent hydrolase
VISHGGLFLSDKDYTRPINFIKVLESFPELTFVIAHLGAGFWDESIDMAKKYSNLYFDTSAAIHGDDVQKPLSDEEAVTIIRKIGVEKIMFGSDFPWYHPGRSLKRILGIGLSEKEKRAILAENAVRIYNL